MTLTYHAETKQSIMFDLCGKFRYHHHGWSEWQPGPVPTERDEEL
jgi:hypothetical protein